MIIAARLKNFLRKHQVPYQIHHHPKFASAELVAQYHHISLPMVAKASVFGDEKGAILVVSPLDKPVNAAQLLYMTGRALERLAPTEANRRFSDCEPGQTPAFGEPYELVTYMDRALLKHSNVYFSSGSVNTLLQIETKYLMRLNSHRMLRFFQENAALSMAQAELPIATVESPSVCHLQRFYAIPQLPAQIKEWLAFPEKPLNREAIESVIASSSLLNKCRHVFEGTPDSDRFAAFSRMILSVKASECFAIPEAGVLGLQRLSQEALLSGMVVQSMAPYLKGLNIRVLHLAALFHNFGFLLMAHVFAPEFRMLNKLMLAHPESPIESLEARIVGLGSAHQWLGQGHARMGAWLMRHWGMPEGVDVLVANHHNAAYQGPMQAEVDFLLLLGQALREEGVGEAEIHVSVQSGRYERLGIQSSVLLPRIREICSLLREENEPTIILQAHS